MGLFKKMKFNKTKKYALQDMRSEQYALGNYYYNGECVEQDYKAAVKWFIKAAQKKNSYYGGKLYNLAVPEAWYMLGLCFKDGTGVKQDYFNALQMFLQLIPLTPGDAERIPAGLTSDSAMQIRELLSRMLKYSDSEDAQMQYQLGWCYRYTAYKYMPGVENWEASKNIALQYFTKSAEKGHAGSACRLAGIYERDNEKRAAEWYMRASEMGSRDAQYTLADAYRIGKLGFTKNETMAIEYYKKAATATEFGSAWIVSNSQKTLGDIYKKRCDYAEAKTWYLKALEPREDPWFCVNSYIYSRLGEMALEQNDKRSALEWFNKGIYYDNNVDCQMGCKSLLHYI